MTVRYVELGSLSDRPQQHYAHPYSWCLEVMTLGEKRVWRRNSLLDTTSTRKEKRGVTTLDKSNDSKMDNGPSKNDLRTTALKEMALK